MNQLKSYSGKVISEKKILWSLSLLVDRKNGGSLQVATSFSNFHVGSYAARHVFNEKYLQYVFIDMSQLYLY